MEATRLGLLMVPDLVRFGKLGTDKVPPILGVVVRDLGTTF